MAVAIITFIGSIYVGVVVDSRAGIIIGCGLVFSLICIIMYALKKVMRIYVQNGGGKAYGLSFKRSVIEGVAVDTDKVQKAIELINKAVLQQNQ